MIVERLFTFMAEPHFLRRPTHGRRVAIATPTMREPAQETLKPLFAAVVIEITWMAIVFAAITWRYSDGEPAAPSSP